MSTKNKTKKTSSPQPAARKSSPTVKQIKRKLAMLDNQRKRYVTKIDAMGVKIEALREEQTNWSRALETLTAEQDQLIAQLPPAEQMELMLKDVVTVSKLSEV
jgi:hypothetical protein